MSLVEKLFSKLFKKTLTYKIYDLLYSFYSYIKDLLYISDTLYSKEFSAVIKQYLHLDLQKDWIGRLYGVMNPNIDIDGNFDFNNTIIELDDEYTNNNEFVKHFIYKQLFLISEVFKINKLYDYIDLEIKHVGPQQYDNYLIIFDIVSRKETARCVGRLFRQLLYYVIMLGIGIGTYQLINIYI